MRTVCSFALLLFLGCFATSSFGCKSSEDSSENASEASPETLISEGAPALPEPFKSFAFGEPVAPMVDEMGIAGEYKPGSMMTFRLKGYAKARFRFEEGLSFDGGKAGRDGKLKVITVHWKPKDPDAVLELVTQRWGAPMSSESKPSWTNYTWKTDELEVKLQLGERASFDFRARKK